ncbi:MAG: aminodeoxychorismate synthase component I, partial [bacterium]
MTSEISKGILQTAGNEMNFNSILDTSGTVFIDDRDAGLDRGSSYSLCDPIDIIIAQSVNEVAEALIRLDERIRAGKYVAGYIAYDAGLALDKPIRSRHSHPSPVLWLGVYDNCLRFEADKVDLGESGAVTDVQDIRLNIDESEYLDRVERAKQYISAGDVYQVNYTCKLRFKHTARPASLFARLRRAHPVPHAAFINTGEEQVISLSPELFLRREGQKVLTRPMKGTMKRGRWFEEDQAMMRRLSTDEKNRAENLMIVDLMRNDIGRVCRIGQVDVTRLFHVERYASLFQMTSDVVGVLQEETSARDLLRAVFPPGSVTGAPKIRAMEIIDELEHEARGVYCGSIALFQPNGDCLLNVVIRTIVQRGEECEMGVGSGIVADSDARLELAETRLKGYFLGAEHRSFHLLETMRLRADGKFVFLEEHIERMRGSAAYFGWDFPETCLREALEGVASKVTGDTRVRLLLAEDGNSRVQCSEIGPPSNQPVRVLLASRKTDPSDLFSYHKTTRREAYDADWRKAHEEGYFDLIYLNTNGEVTEGAITNLIANIDGRWFTPPLRSGLLPGIWRAQKLKQNHVEERVLTWEDLL